MYIAATQRVIVVAALSGDLRNLLQMAASALHLLDLKLDGDLRPLARSAIRPTAASVQALLPANTLDLTRSIS